MPLAVLWIGASDVFAGRITGGELSQFLLYSILAAGSLAAGCSRSPLAADDPGAFAAVVADDARLRLLVTGLRFTEGPVWSDADGGFLVFSDMTANRLMRWSARDGASVFRDPVPEPNGNARDATGRLHTCEHAARRVSRTEPSGEVVTVVDAFDGKRLNSPNDLAFSRDGALWFTDPSYGLRGVAPEVDGEYVYRLAPDGALAVVARGFDHPNGICLSPDERRLFVSDSGAPRNVRAFDVGPGGEVTGGEVVHEVDAGIPDGMACDADGRLYVTAGDGVHVLAPDGSRLGKILVPESCANVTFGGADRRTLFVTAGRSLYAIDLLVAGAAP